MCTPRTLVPVKIHTDKEKIIIKLLMFSMLVKLPIKNKYINKSKSNQINRINKTDVLHYNKTCDRLNHHT